MTVLQEAEQIINGPRREAYGPVEESFKRIAAVSNSHSRDNLVDIAVYAGLLDALSNAGKYALSKKESPPSILEPEWTCDYCGKTSQWLVDPGVMEGTMHLHAECLKRIS